MGRAFAWLLLISLILQFPWEVTHVLAQSDDYLIVPGQRFGGWELGKPLNDYRLGEPFSRVEQKTNDIAWNDFYTFSVSPESLTLWVFTCKTDSLVFAIMGVRQIGRTELTEATKYKTADGVGIGSDESEILRLLGQPPSSFDSRDSAVRGAEVAVKVYDYPGLRIRISLSDRKVYALGATTRNGFAACQQAVVGGSPTATRTTPLSEAVLRVARDAGVPLPNNARMTPPGPDIAPERAAFFGAWIGKWNSGLPHIFVAVEITVNPTRVVGIYATGVAGRSQGAWSYVRGTFSGSDLILEKFSNGAQVTYRVNSDGTLSGTYDVLGIAPSTIRMQRIKD